MTDYKAQEALMVRVMHALADAFGNHAVLKGGMLLRLLDCPRHTNDLDYVFVPFRSNKDIAAKLTAVLRKISDTPVSCTLNSKCIRCAVTSGGARIQVEANVDLICGSQAFTTAEMARIHGQPGRVIRGMRPDLALTHKMAAWNERRLVRDLFDIHFYHRILGVSPVAEILKHRLHHAPAKKREPRPARTISALAESLRQTAAALEDSALEELHDYLAPAETAGLAPRIKASLEYLCEWLLRQSD